MNHTSMRLQRERASGRGRYQPPGMVATIPLADALSAMGRPALDPRQMDLLSSAREGAATLYYAGDLDLLRAPCVSIVGTREVSEEGYLRARRLARELVAAGVTVVSGLAKGVDTAAHRGAIDHGGRTAAVIGTPLDKAYPAENSELQETIYREHLLISPFAQGEATFKANFPKRNRVMAALSDATVIVEASDTSGTLHQAAECQRLKRWLFIMQSVASDPLLTWPRKFIGKDRVAVLTSTAELLSAIAK
jgi:DNA processing protein